MTDYDVIMPFHAYSSFFSALALLCSVADVWGHACQLTSPDLCADEIHISIHLHHKASFSPEKGLVTTCALPTFGLPYFRTTPRNTTYSVLVDSQRLWALIKSTTKTNETRQKRATVLNLTTLLSLSLLNNLHALEIFISQSFLIILTFGLRFLSHL